jgi:hypothetical protein
MKLSRFRVTEIASEFGTTPGAVSARGLDQGWTAILANEDLNRSLSWQARH